ncbi:MAG: ABC transporter ATP-binding protein [Armatimonadetes bacterium]|nr:ABC transporter ATP-binding protein [Armatimonadota bacterium]MDW8152646.1 ABC transporter ATP-binding protein [Armatimonadota bacterium]
MVHVEAGYYPEQTVLQGVSLIARPGQLTAVLGPNGSGKSTVLRVVYGLLRPRRGTVWVDGEDVSQLPAHRRVDLGMGYLPQGRSVFPGLTVQENLEVGAWALPRAARRSALDRIYERYPGLKAWRDRPAGVLSGGQQRMVEIARMMVTDPWVILLDEPTAGLAPVAAQEVYEEVARLHREGRTVLLVDQNVRAAVSLADYVYALAFGRNQLEGTRDEFQQRMHAVVRDWLRV